MVLIGCDPELFLRKDGNYHSAYGLIPGTKKEPYKVTNGAVQVDGMALEFNTVPTDSADTFADHVNSVMQQLREMVPAEYHFSIVPAAHFTKAHLATQPKEALLLGCDPDFNAYTELPNDPPNADTTLRTASGHVHIGWTSGADIENAAHLNRCRMLVKQLDVFLGMPAMAYDKDRERRKLYGKAGCFRPKPYGVEYRVLSNFWLTNVVYMQWVHNMAVLAFLYLEKGKVFSDLILKESNLSPQEIIDRDMNDVAQHYSMQYQVNA